MKKKFAVTSHTIVKNEEKWIKQSLLSVIDHVEEMLVWDTGSTDKTVALINSLGSPKIKFCQKGKVNRRQLAKLREQQIKTTKTEWFLILDGDEIWPKKNLLSLLEASQRVDKNIIAFVNKTRNCVGDILHFLPETAGHYQIGNWRGHLNIRLIRNLKGLEIQGNYPLEAYVYDGKLIQEQVERLKFLDTWYLHATHLKRSGWWHQIKTLDRLKKFKLLQKGIKMDKKELPEVLR